MAVPSDPDSIDWRYIRGRARQYALLMRLDRPIGILLLLWPTLSALWLAAEGVPEPGVLVVFVLGVILMRSAGCVINDYADRKVDSHVRRTSQRPLVSGGVKPDEAILLFILLLLAAFLLVLTLNTFTIFLSFGGVLLAAVYPFMKRFTHLPQVVLGMAFGWAIPMAFVAQTGEVPKQAWLLFVITVIWAVIYDTMYAMVDREDDLKIGVKSTAILFADADRLIIGVLQITMLLGLLLLGRQLELSLPYYVGLLLAALLALYHQFLIRHREPTACFRAFLHNNWLGAVVFLGIVASYLQ